MNRAIFRCFSKRCATLETMDLSINYNGLFSASHAWDGSDIVSFSV